MLNHVLGDIKIHVSSVPILHVRVYILYNAEYHQFSITCCQPTPKLIATCTCTCASRCFTIILLGERSPWQRCEEET